MNREAIKTQGDVIWNIAHLLRGPDGYKPPRELAGIEKNIEDLGRDIVAMLKETTA